MRIDELAPLLAKKLQELNKQSLDLLKDWDGVRLSVLVPVVRLVGGQDDVWTRLVLQPVQVDCSHTNIGSYLCLILCL